MSPVNYMPLKQLGSPALIVEPTKHRMGIARIRVAQPESMEIPDTGYLGPKLAEDPRYCRSCGTSLLAKTLAVSIDQTPGHREQSS